MPQKSQDNMKGTSPSKVIQNGVDQAWGQQNKGGTDAQSMINQQFNRNPGAPVGTGDDRKKTP